MGTAVVGTAQMPDVSALVEQLAKLPVGEWSYYLVQRPDDITDWQSGRPKGAALASYTAGRLFGEAGEIRWRQTPNGYALLWLSENHLPDGFETLGRWETTESQEVFLLGGGETQPWQDTRIPRELNYPINWCRFPKVKVISYKDAVSQTIQFTRYSHFIRGG